MGKAKAKRQDSVVLVASGTLMAIIVVAAFLQGPPNTPVAAEKPAPTLEQAAH